MQRILGSACFSSFINSTPLFPGSLISIIAISGACLINWGRASSAEEKLEITAKSFDLRIKSSRPDLKWGSSSIIETVVKALILKIQGTYL